jgi:uncharacterized membrane protein
MWQYDEFSLDIGIKLFYINIISFGLINFILLFSATFFSYICTILYDIYTILVFKKETLPENEVKCLMELVVTGVTLS